MSNALSEEEMLSFLPPTPRPSAVMEQVIKNLELRHEFGEDAFAGERVGLKEMDQYISFEGGRLFMLGGPPGSGKTALALQMAKYIGTREIVANVETGETSTGVVLYYITEMTAEDCMLRIVQNLTGLSDYDLKKNVTASVLAKAREAAEVISKSNVFIIEAAGVTPTQLRLQINRAYAKFGHQLRAVFVDNLTGVGHSGHASAPAHVKHEATVHALKDLALQLRHVPIICLAHTKRPEGARDTPIMSDFANTSAIERDAHVLMILQPIPETRVKTPVNTTEYKGLENPFEVGPSDDAQTSTHELFVLKNRSDKTDFVIDLVFKGAEMRFEDPDGPTWRPYQEPTPESIRTAQYRQAKFTTGGF